MDIRVCRVKQYNSTYKFILMIDGEPVCITRGGKRANECIRYVNGETAEMNDGVIRKILDLYRKGIVNTDSPKKPPKKKHKAIHKFTESEE